jgi:hypothetical protein
MEGYGVRREEKRREEKKCTDLIDGGVDSWCILSL